MVAHMATDVTDDMAIDMADDMAIDMATNLARRPGDVGVRPADLARRPRNIWVMALCPGDVALVVAP